jgi:hypothetical protein
MLSVPDVMFSVRYTYETMNLYAIEMAAVFMISTSTLVMRTGFTPLWIASLGFTFVLLLLFSGRYIDWIIWSSRCGYF